VRFCHEYQNKGLSSNKRIGLEVVCFGIDTRSCEIDAFAGLAGDEMDPSCVRASGSRLLSNGKTERPSLRFRVARVRRLCQENYST
jgi:hypothetical protein